MNTPTQPTNPVSTFQLAESLVALHPDATAKAIPFRDRGNTDANWIIGVKPVSDDASVHAGHWERHPLGEEVLCLLEGRVVVTLSAGKTPEQQVTLIEGRLSSYRAEPGTACTWSNRAD